MPSPYARHSLLVETKVVPRSSHGADISHGMLAVLGRFRVGGSMKLISFDHLAALALRWFRAVKIQASARCA